MDYLNEHLLESAAPADPIELFDAWLADAFAAKEDGVLPEPTAMVVATSTNDQPSARTVLLKSAGPDGFVFFTNYDSRKGREIAASSAVALHFGWYPLHRQVRVEGTRRTGQPQRVGGLLRDPPARLPARRLGVGPIDARSPRWRS